MQQRKKVIPAALWSKLGFGAFLLFVFVLVSGWTMFLGPPSGIHFTRQTDSLSFVANYAAGASFTQPEVYSLNSVEGRAAAEFPILYWLTGQLWKLFGEHEWILRLLGALLTLGGFFALLRVALRFVNDAFLGWALTSLTAASPIVFYYLPNVLPDASALGCALLGWAAFVGYWMDGQQRSGYATIAWFGLSGLLKVTYFIFPLAALASLVVLGWKESGSPLGSIRQHLAFIAGIVLAALAVGGWNVYAIHYNSVYTNYYFLVESRPIWDMSAEAVNQVWAFVTEYWHKHYYIAYFFPFLGVLILLSLVWLRYGIARLQAIAWFSLLGGIAYLLLFFKQFRDHDYYFMVFIPVVGLNLINAAVTLRRRFGGMFFDLSTKLFLYLLLSASLWQLDLVDRYRKVEMERRFDNTSAVYTAVRGALDREGIPRDAKLLVVADPSENGSLYFLRRKGWTVADGSAFTAELAETYRLSGAQYLVCSPGFEPPASIQNIVLTANGVRVYALN